MLLEKSRTEKFLIATISVLLFALVLNIFNNEPLGLLVATAKSESSSGSEKSGGSESEKSEGSEYSEESYYYEEEVEAVEVPVVVPVAPISVPAVTAPQSSDAVGEDESEEGEIVVEDFVEEKKAITSIAGFDKLLSIDGNTALVVNIEKFLFIFRVEIESEVELDDDGNVMSQKQSFGNKVLSLLSV